jgi:hypothetical protein
MKRKTRKTLPGQIRNEPSQGIRQELAWFGKRVSHNVHRVKFWHERWIRTQDTKGRMPLADFEREALLSIFMRPLVKLNANFFADMARAICIYRNQTTPPDKVLHGLNDLALWLVRPPLTSKEIADHIGYRGDMNVLRRTLTALRVPWKKLRGGRPKIRTNKRSR